MIKALTTLVIVILLSGCITRNDPFAEMKMRMEWIEKNCHLECDVNSEEDQLWEAGEYLEVQCYQIHNETGEICDN